MGIQVKVVRAFWYGGARKEPGTIVEVDDYVAREIIALGKAEKAGAPAPAVSAPLTTASVPDLIPGKARKGAKDAE
jgi:hypothetical protein